MTTGLQQIMAPAAFGGRGWIDAVKSITDADSPYAVTADDVFIYANATAAVVEIDLPANPDIGRLVGAKNTGDGTFAVTVDGNGNNIEGAASISLAGAEDGKIFHFDGSEWQRVAEVT